jgi:hypothetical protein
MSELSSLRPPIGEIMIGRYGVYPVALHNDRPANNRHLHPYDHDMYATLGEFSLTIFDAADVPLNSTVLRAPPRTDEDMRCLTVALLKRRADDFEAILRGLAPPMLVPALTTHQVQKISARAGFLCVRTV